jgi:hypothetical protein
VRCVELEALQPPQPAHRPHQAVVGRQEAPRFARTRAALRAEVAGRGRV